MSIDLNFPFPALINSVFFFLCFFFLNSLNFLFYFVRAPDSQSYSWSRCLIVIYPCINNWKSFEFYLQKYKLNDKKTKRIEVIKLTWRSISYLKPENICGILFQLYLINPNRSLSLSIVLCYHCWQNHCVRIPCNKCHNVSLTQDTSQHYNSIKAWLWGNFCDFTNNHGSQGEWKLAFASTFDTI